MVVCWLNSNMLFWVKSVSGVVMISKGKNKVQGFVLSVQFGIPRSHEKKVSAQCVESRLRGRQTKDIVVVSVIAEHLIYGGKKKMKSKSVECVVQNIPRQTEENIAQLSADKDRLIYEIAKKIVNELILGIWLEVEKEDN